MRSSSLKMGLSNTVRRCAPSKTVSRLGPSTKWCDFTVIGKSRVFIVVVLLDTEVVVSERLGEENRQSKSSISRNTSLKRSRSPSSDDESSVYGFGGDVPRQVCGACRSKESAVWWKAPRGLPSEVMCDQCGISWRKYGDIRSGRIDEPKKGNGVDKKENTPQPPVKRTKVSIGMCKRGTSRLIMLSGLCISRTLAASCTAATRMLLL